MITVVRPKSKVHNFQFHINMSICLFWLLKYELEMTVALLQIILRCIGTRVVILAERIRTQLQ